LSLVLVLRVVLKRESSGVAVSDLLVLVLLADAVQNGMSGEYTSVGDALILATTLIFWDWVLDYLAFRFAWLGHLMHPKPLLIVKDGAILAHNARRKLLTRRDIQEQLLAQGIQSIAEVAKAYVLSTGEISVVRKEE